MAKKRLFVFVFATFVAGSMFAQTAGFSLGARVMGIVPFYKPSSNLSSALAASGASIDLEGKFGFGFAVQAAYNFTDLFGIQAEILLNNSDEIAVKAMGIEAATLKASSLLFPILIRVGTGFDNGIQLTGIGGLYFTIPLGDGEIKLSQLAGGGSLKGEWKGSVGMMFGGIIGYKVGPGSLFADLRYGFDFSEIEFKFNNVSEKALKKSAFHIGIGYSIPIGGNK